MKVRFTGSPVAASGWETACSRLPANPQRLERGEEAGIRAARRNGVTPREKGTGLPARTPTYRAGSSQQVCPAFCSCPGRGSHFCDAVSSRGMAGRTSEEAGFKGVLGEPKNRVSGEWV